MALRSAPCRPPAREGGFTLIELMAVVLLMGTMLLLVPANLDSLGAEGKLKNTGNSLIAAVNGARDLAVLDAYEVSLEIGTFRADERWEHGWRFRFTSVPPAAIGDAEDRAGQERHRMARTQEREWLYSNWHRCDDGVKFVGVSQGKGQWDKLNDGGRSFTLRFFADGTVEGGAALRLENTEMEAEREYRTITLFVNGLTAEASWVAGEQELSEILPATALGN